MEASDLSGQFVDGAGFEVIFDLLQGPASGTALYALEEDETRTVYFADARGLWRVSEPPALVGPRDHVFEFAPFDSITEVVASMTGGGRNALIGIAATRHYTALANAVVEVRMREGDPWTIYGSRLVVTMYEDDKRAPEILRALFGLCRTAADNGIAVRVVAPGVHADLAHKSTGAQTR